MARKGDDIFWRLQAEKIDEWGQGRQKDSKTRRLGENTNADCVMRTLEGSDRQ